MSNRCRRLPTPSRRERKRPQRIASPASEPVLRPTPTPVNVSLGAIAHSAPIPTVLPTHLFSVAWLPRIFGPRRSRDLASSPARYTFELKLAEVPSGPLNSELELLRPRQGHISSAIARAAVRFPTTAVVAF